MGDAGFALAIDQELGTFFLTDYKVRDFERIVMKRVGFCNHSQLRDRYFVHYNWILYNAQANDAVLVE